MQPNPTESYQQPTDSVLAALGTDAQRGLSVAEVRARLERDGRNELTTEEPVPPWRKFLAQFQDVLVVLLLIATVISGVLWAIERTVSDRMQRLVSHHTHFYIFFIPRLFFFTPF